MCDESGQDKAILISSIVTVFYAHRVLTFVVMKITVSEGNKSVRTTNYHKEHRILNRRFNDI